MQASAHATGRLAVHDRLEIVPCPVCGATESNVYVWAPSHYGPEKYQISRCARCRMIFTNPQPVTYATEVLTRGVTSGHFQEEHVRRDERVAGLVLETLRPLVRGRRILDFGCGEGSFVRSATLAGWEAVGIDLNPGLVEEAKRRSSDLRLELYGISLDDFIASKPEPFDAIVALQVFEHLQRPVDTGAQLCSLLRPGGLLYVDVPNANQLAEWVNRGSTLDPTAHWNHFTTRTLAQLFAKFGCRVVATTGAPSFVNVYARLGLGRFAYPLGRVTRRILPGIGTGVCVIGSVT